LAFLAVILVFFKSCESWFRIHGSTTAVPFYVIRHYRNLCTGMGMIDSDFLKEAEMQIQGIIMGKYIELLYKTDLPDGQVVTLSIKPEILSLEEKKRQIDKLCGSWEDDKSLETVFTEIKNNRLNSMPREVNFDVSS